MPTDHFRKDTAQLVALFVEAICYGLYLDTFFRCVYILFRKSTGWKRRSEIQLGNLAVTIALFLFASANLSLGLVRAIQAFIYQEGMGPGGTFGKRWVSIVKVPLTLNLQTMVADGALIGQCWQVYGRRWIIVSFPLFLWFAGWGVTIWETLFETDIQKNPSYSGMLNIAYTIFWAISVLQKVYATGMIICRIRRVESGIRPLQPKSEVSLSNPAPSSAPSGETTKRTSLSDVLRIVIDSGLMYTITSFVAFCSQLALSNSVYITTSAVSTGIVSVNRI
ncbi:hypothetical protein GALMADRAFT_138417 [Galerina marginata CBS 339.88]|uniref:Uncharacterized protein n=1 Tax=Galerina marginata (strain CBS 339.88) TaxID=685588 RepID=A0A067T7G8_GALM3|nr:hypothetical protein GALMADRAFT_138417 [Galerina marginata CBS 339.88]